MIWIFLLTYFFTGMVFVIIGALMKKFPPKKINWWYGYRTRRSMRNLQMWDEAHRYAPNQLMNGGLMLMIIGCAISFLIGENETAQAVSFLVLTVVFTFHSIIKTEAHLKKLFDKNGNRIS